MIYKKRRLYDKDQTASEMYRIVNGHYRDLHRIKLKKRGLKPLSQLGLLEFYNAVRVIPYRRDISPIEVVSRPMHILRLRRMGMDCKKKAILMGSYCKCNQIPYRFIASSRKKNRRIHHVFPQAFLNGEWRSIDATYPYYKIFQNKEFTRAEVL